MNALLAASLLLVAIGGGAVALCKDPVRQAILLSFYGLMLGSMFFVLQAPDVALSQVAVGTVALPIMLMLALRRLRRNSR